MFQKFFVEQFEIDSCWYCYDSLVNNIIALVMLKYSIFFLVFFFFI